MKNSKIQWTDHTFNPWIGCTKISPGCANGYCGAYFKRFGVTWGPGPRKRTSVSYWKQPLAWDRDSAEGVAEGILLDKNIKRARVFCASLADWLDDEVPLEWLVDLLDLIRLTPHLDWLLLTKRPENWYRRIAEAGLTANHAEPRNSEVAEMALAWIKGTPPQNIWAGITIENQEMANLRVPVLLSIPAKVRFLSCEPLLGPIDLTPWLHPEGRCGECLELIQVRHDSVSCGCCCEGAEPTLERTDLIDWVICGGESGPQARPMHPDWVRSLRDQCKAAGVPFFFKQWGEWLPEKQMIELQYASKPQRGGQRLGNLEVINVGKKTAGRFLDGDEHNEFPEVQS